MAKLEPGLVIKRIRQLRLEKYGTRGKRSFAFDIGISPSSYNYYEKDRLAPIAVLLRIADITETDLRWLLTGETTTQGPVYGGKNSDLHRKIEDILEKDPAAKEPLEGFLELLSEKKDVEQRLDSRIPQPKYERPGWIPVLGRTAAGIVHLWSETAVPEPKYAITQLEDLVSKYTGRAITNSVEGKVEIETAPRPLKFQGSHARASLVQVRNASQEQSSEFVDCESLQVQYPDAFALRIDGESMSPRINDGDIVVLSPSVIADQGQVCVAKIADQIGVTCKLIRIAQERVYLTPINQKYDIIEISSEKLLWALAVLCHISIGNA